MEFKKGDMVKIKMGVKFEGISTNIEGWHGRIGVSDYNDPNWTLIELDSVVIKNMPEDYILQGLKDADIDTFNHFNIEKKDLESATARDTVADVETALQEIEDKYFWKALSDGSPEEELIAEVLANIGRKEPIFVWEEYLQENLTFPFVAEVVEADFRNQHKIGMTFKVTEIQDTDDFYGVIVKGRKRISRMNHALCDLEVVDMENPNYLPVRAYVVWFANR